MGDFYRTCDIHGKPFPHNQIDTRKTKMCKIYVEQRQDIEGKDVNMNLFVDKSADNEGLDVCANCLQEKVLHLVTATDNTPAWKVVKWMEEEATKKNGDKYMKNTKHVFTAEQITEQIKADKAKGAQPANPPKAQ